MSAQPPDDGDDLEVELPDLDPALDAIKQHSADIAEQIRNTFAPLADTGTSWAKLGRLNTDAFASLTAHLNETYAELLRPSQELLRQFARDIGQQSAEINAAFLRAAGSEAAAIRTEVLRTAAHVHTPIVLTDAIDITDEAAHAVAAGTATAGDFVLLMLVAAFVVFLVAAGILMAEGETAGALACFGEALALAASIDQLAQRKHLEQ